MRGEPGDAPLDSDGAFAMLAAAHLLAVRYEEPSPARRFGDPYREYRRTTPRWIPRPPNR